MELLYKSFLQTSTQLVVNTNTATAQNIMFRDTRFEFASDNFASDLTTVTMRINFDETVTVDRIAMVGHNLKKFSIYHGGVTANTLNLESDQATTTTNFLTNSTTAQYFRLATPTAMTSLSIDMYSTIVADQNKKIGYLAVTKVRSDFNDRGPVAQGYRPVVVPQNVVHKMSDGGTRIQTLEDKWQVNFSLDFIDLTTRNELKEIYDDHEDLIFCAYGTTTAWDEVIFPCVWAGDFDFYQYSDNAIDAGFSGSIRLMETPL